MTLTRHRLLAALALPAGLALLGACGSGDTNTTSTDTASVATSTTASDTGSPTSSASGTRTGDDEESSKASGTKSSSSSSSTTSGADKLPASFTALGTEPFWDIQVAGRTLTYSGPDIETKVMEAERTTSGETATYTGNHEGTAFKLTMTRGSCNDGMSDNEYQYKVEWTFGDQTNQGCART